MYAESHIKHEITTKEWSTCKEYFNNCCAYCGFHVDNHYVTRLGKQIKSDLHKEHVDHNGADDLSNCVPSCRECNSEKGTFLLDEWYNENNKKFSEERLMKIDGWLNGDYQTVK